MKKDSEKKLDADQKIISSLLSKDFLNEKATYKLSKIVEMQNKKKDKTFDFQKFKTIKSFGRELHNNDLSLDDTLEQLIRLKNDTDIFKESTKPKSVQKRNALTFKNPIKFLNGRCKFHNAFESGVFPKGKQGKGLKSILNYVAGMAKVSDP